MKKLKPKIGFLISKFNHGGGTERVTAAIANGLNQRGYDISIISCQKGLSPIFDINKNVSLFSLHGELVSSSIKRKLSNLKHLKTIVKQQQIDILITVDVELYIYAFPLQLMKLCKVIAWEHFNYFREYRKLEKLSQQLAARYANELIVLGKKDLQNYQQNEKKLTKIDYIYNPVFVDTNRKTDLKNNVALSVGRLENQKGFDLLLRAWKIVEKNGINWKLRIVGNGNEKEKLFDLKRQLKLKNVEFVPYTKNIINEYLNASLYIMSSRFEGYPLVLIEAQKCGLPIISFDCHEGPSEIIKDNINGYLIKSNDYHKLGEKISYLLNKRNILESFHDNADIDANKYNLSDILNKWEDIINNL